MHTPSTASIEVIDLSNIKTLIENDKNDENSDIINDNKSDNISNNNENNENGNEIDDDDFQYVPPAVGIVFGRERYGLTNEELALADSTIYIPANENYSVLNLAQAVNIIGYELYKRQCELKDEVRTGGVLSIRTSDRLANRDELEMFLSRLKENLLSRNYKAVAKNNNETKDTKNSKSTESSSSSSEAENVPGDEKWLSAAELRNENSPEFYRELKFRAIQQIFRRVRSLLLSIRTYDILCIFLYLFWSPVCVVYIIQSRFFGCYFFLHCIILHCIIFI